MWGGPPDPGKSPGSFSLLLPTSVQVSISPFVWFQAQRLGLWLGTTGTVSPLPHSLSLSLYREGLGNRSDASTDCQHTQLARLKLNLRFRHWLEAKVCLTFKHIYIYKRQNKTSKLLQTEAKVSKYLWNTICSNLFSMFCIFWIQTGPKINLSAVITHYISISTDRYYFPLTAIHKDKNLYALTL